MADSFHRILEFNFNNSVNRLKISGKNFQNHWSSIKEKIVSKYGLSLMSDCHIIINEKNIDSEAALEKELLNSKPGKVQVTIKRGKFGAQQDNGIKAIVISDKSGKQCSWNYTKNTDEKENDASGSNKSTFGEFKQSVLESLGIDLKDRNDVSFYEIDNINDVKNRKVKIEDENDFICCFDDKMTQFTGERDGGTCTVYFVVVQVPQDSKVCAVCVVCAVIVVQFSFSFFECFCFLLISFFFFRFFVL